MTIRKRTRLAAGLVALVFLLGTGARGKPKDPEQGLGTHLAALIAAANYTAALKMADAALVDRADSVVAWQYRAYALHQLGRSEESLAAYRKTVAIDPANWWAHMNLGSLLATRKEWSQAIRSVRRAIAIRPTERVAQARLSQIYRDRGDYRSARMAIQIALSAGTDPAWCHAELGYLTWVLGDSKASRAHWIRARSLGADAEDYAHGLRLIDWEGRPPSDPEKRLEERRRRHGPGLEWVFNLGRIEVHTRVGPKLPRDLEKLFAGLVSDDARFLGIKGDWPFKVRLYLSRTIEAHEVHRRREFPGGYPGKAFHVDRRSMGGMVGSGKRRGPRWEPSMGGTLDMYAAWPVTGLKKSLSHELAHALMRIRLPRATVIPAWIDEGIATYLELASDERGRPVSRLVRHDLLAELREARALRNALTWSSMLASPRSAFQGIHARARYAQAWSMVHFLLEGQRSGGERRLQKYLGLLSNGMGSRINDFLRTFGTDLEATEAAWVRHIDGLATR
jgi:tetratricopeptide (TPR) repeat protein